jgi:2,4-dienoyl-CoA reductase-like NADH-dependent reductase (Old Yellow Enzyme family)
MPEAGGLLQQCAFQLVSDPMPDLFSPYTLKGITLRNRVAMSPMTMYRSVDGCINDFHVMLMGSRAAGGFSLVFPEQLAITPDGRTGTSCAGIYDGRAFQR